MKKNIRYLLSICLIVGSIVLLAEKTFSQEKSTYVKGMTAGRARALIGVGVGLLSLGIGWAAKARHAKNAQNGPRGAVVAIVLGIIGIVLSIVHLSVTAGAVFGSGSGKAGAIVAFVPNLIGIAFGWLVLRKTNENK